MADPNPETVTTAVNGKLERARGRLRSAQIARIARVQRRDDRNERPSTRPQP
jgi:hypothetical protein